MALGNFFKTKLNELEFPSWTNSKLIKYLCVSGDKFLSKSKGYERSIYNYVKR